MTTSLATGWMCGLAEDVMGRARPDFRARLVWLGSAEANQVLLSAIGLGVMVIALVWSLSRSGIICFGFAVACFAWLVARRQSIGRAQRTLALALLSSVLVAGLSWRGLSRLLPWFSDLTDLHSRIDAWRDGWRVVQDFALTGTGINTYPIAMLFYQRHNMELWMTHAHNDYLQLLAEGGLMVTVPTLTVVVLFVVSVRKRMRCSQVGSDGHWIRCGACVGLLAIAIQEVAEFSLHIPANMFLCATLVAIALSPPEGLLEKRPVK